MPVYNAALTAVWDMQGSALQADPYKRLEEGIALIQGSR
jgi:hypothetical protein